jgi:hypothetical protein
MNPLIKLLQSPYFQGISEKIDENTTKTRVEKWRPMLDW